MSAFEKFLMEERAKKEGIKLPASTKDYSFEALERKYGFAPEPSQKRTGGAGNVLGSIARELVSVIPKTGIQIGKAIGAVDKDKSEFDVPVFGKVTMPTTALGKAGLLADQLLTFVPFAKIAKGFSAGAKVVKGTKEASDVVKAANAASKLKRSGITASVVSNLMDLERLTSGIAPKATEISLDLAAAKTGKTTALDKLRRAVDGVKLEPKQFPLPKTKDDILNEMIDQFDIENASEEIIKRSGNGLRPFDLAPTQEAMLRGLLKETDDDIIRKMFGDTIEETAAGSDDILKKMLGVADEVPVPKPTPSLDNAEILEKIAKQLGVKGPVSKLPKIPASEVVKRAQDLLEYDLPDIPKAAIQKSLDDVARYNSTIDKFADLEKSLNPFSPDVIKAARKTLFYRDLIDASALGAAYGAAKGAQNPDANALSVISDAAKGAAFGGAFPVVGSVFGTFGRNVVDPVFEKLGDWVKSTKLYDYVLGQSANVLKKLGSTNGTGARIAQGIENIRDYSEIMRNRDISDLLPKINTKAMTDDQRTLLADVIRGRKRIAAGDTKNKIVQEAADVWRRVADEIGDAAIDSKFMLINLEPSGKITKTPFKKNQFYYPRFLDTQKFMSKEGFTKARNVLMDKKGYDQEQATNFLLSTIAGHEQSAVFAQILKRTGLATKQNEIQKQISRYYEQGSPKRFSSLEYSRKLDDIPDELLITDPRIVMPRYITEARRRLAEAQTFGVNNELLYAKPSAGEATGLITEIKDPYEQALAQKIVQRILGTEPLDAASAAGTLETLRGLQVFSMGLSAFSNATQSTNTATVGGIRNLMKGIYDSTKKEGREFALKSGSVTDDTIRDVIRGATGTQGFHGIQDSFLRAVGMSLFERINRTFAANTARRFILDNEKALLKNPMNQDIRSKFMELRLDPDDIVRTRGFIKNAEGGLSDPRLLHMARRFTESTQFRVGPEDLPLLWSSDFGRLLTQFKSFSYKQAQFIKKHVLGQAREGNLAPLASYLTAAQILGHPTAEIKAYLRGSDKREDKEGMELALDNVLAVGGLGLFSDAVYSASQGGSGAARFLMGPTFSDIADVAGRAGTGLKSGNFKPLAKFGVAQIPVIGPGLASGIDTQKGVDSDYGDIPVIGQFLK